MAIFISFNSFDIAYFVQPCNIHAACSFDPFDIPWILQNLLFSPTSFWWADFFNISNHLPDSSFALLANLTWSTLWSLPTAVLDDLFSYLGGYFEIFSHSWLLNFIEIRCASFDPFDITFKSISHAKTSLLVNCAGGTQGVQLLDWSNKGQIRAIRLRWVWVTWHPSIWCWSLWIGKSTCSCEPTLSKTEPANAKGNLQAHVLQALKTLFRSKFTETGSLT